MIKDTLKITKRALSYFFFFIIILNLNHVYANDEINIFIDGKALVSDTSPIIIEGTTMVPLRVIAEGLSMEVHWNNETRTINCVKEGSEIKLQIDSNIAFVNGVEKYIEIKPQITNERTLLPLRFISENLGCEVNWEGDTNINQIFSKPYFVKFKDKTIEAAVSKLLNKPAGRILMSDLFTITNLEFSTNTKPAVIIDDLAYMKNLESLSAGRNSIVDISPLSGLTKLFYVFLGNNKIRDLSPLASKENLTVLFVAGDGRVQEYTDISFLKDLPNLKKLEICTSKVSDITPLYGLESIRELSIISTKPIDITPFKKLPNLIELKINNCIIDLSTIENESGEVQQ